VSKRVVSVMSHFGTPDDLYQLISMIGTVSTPTKQFQEP